MNARTVLLLLLVSLPLAACGVKGPLYLPPSDAATEDLPEPPADEGLEEDLDEGPDAEAGAAPDDFSAGEEEGEDESDDEDVGGGEEPGPR